MSDNRKPHAAILPVLPEKTKRILELRWLTLLDESRLSDETIRLCARTSDANRQLALSKPPDVKRNTYDWLRHHSRARHECGISQSETLATRRFDELATEYKKHWSAAEGWEVFAAWLQDVQQIVREEVEAIWRVTSDTKRWFETVCKPAVESAVSHKRLELEGKARHEEQCALIAGASIAYEAAWAIQGEGREFFERLARRGVAALGRKFSEPERAVDFWIERVHAYHAARGNPYSRDSWCTRHLLAASCAYLEELAVQATEAGDANAEKVFLELAEQSRFRPLPSGISSDSPYIEMERATHSWNQLHAIRRKDAQSPAATTEVQAKDARKAERKKLRDDYVAACKAADVRVTDEMIATAANPRWKSRSNVQKWLCCDPKYDGTPDSLIRSVFRRKPHLAKPGSTTSHR